MTAQYTAAGALIRSLIQDCLEASETGVTHPEIIDFAGARVSPKALYSMVERMVKRGEAFCSEPGMVGHYPWAYEERKRRGVNPSLEEEPLYARPLAVAEPSAHAVREALAELLQPARPEEQAEGS